MNPLRCISSVRLSLSGRHVDHLKCTRNLLHRKACQSLLSVCSLITHTHVISTLYTPCGSFTFINSFDVFTWHWLSGIRLFRCFQRMSDGLSKTGTCVITAARHELSYSEINNKIWADFYPCFSSNMPPKHIKTKTTITTENCNNTYTSWPKYRLWTWTLWLEQKVWLQHIGRKLNGVWEPGVILDISVPPR